MFTHAPVAYEQHPGCHGEAQRHNQKFKETNSNRLEQTGVVLGVFGLDGFNYRKQIAIQGLAWLQRAVREFRERRRHDAGAGLKRDVVASPAEGNSAAPQIRGAVARRAMHGAKMERGAITGLQIE